MQNSELWRHYLLFRLGQANVLLKTINGTAVTLVEQQETQRLFAGLAKVTAQASRRDVDPSLASPTNGLLSVRQ